MACCFNLWFFFFLFSFSFFILFWASGAYLDDTFSLLTICFYCVYINPFYVPNCRLGRLQDSNAVLSHFNEYSEHCFAEVSSDFSRNTRLLRSMKSDLDYIFQKLRSMKSKIIAIYPDAFPDDSTRDVLDRRPDLEIPQ
ncbi:hypothetical protein L1049_009674 [Liquidambar formosana]|uniref:KxDL domain-containing protein n=1 Tax=Liquidambar formosana TaxID=63359 RepID=A0AAP0R0S9_LIQFO